MVLNLVADEKLSALNGAFLNAKGIEAADGISILKWPDTPSTRYIRRETKKNLTRQLALNKLNLLRSSHFGPFSLE